MWGGPGSQPKSCGGVSVIWRKKHRRCASKVPHNTHGRGKETRAEAASARHQTRLATRRSRRRLEEEFHDQREGKVRYQARAIKFKKSFNFFKTELLTSGEAKEGGGELKRRNNDHRVKRHCRRGAVSNREKRGERWRAREARRKRDGPAEDPLQ